MNKFMSFHAALLSICCVVFQSAHAKGSFKGTWCVQEQNLTIDFQGDDSLKVASSDEEGINGTGSYAIDDSLIIAKIVNGELTIEMTYRYKWDNDKTVSAQLKSFVINEEAVEHPTEWMSMSRCESSDKKKQTGEKKQAEKPEEEKKK